MVQTCCVLKCKGNYKNGPKVAIFSFPKEDEGDLRQKWINAIKREYSFVPTKNTRVCELHFKKTDIERATNHRIEATGEVITVPLKCARLIKGAVPTKLLGSIRSLSSDSEDYDESIDEDTPKVSPKAKKRRKEIDPLQDEVAEGLEAAETYSDCVQIIGSTELFIKSEDDYESYPQESPEVAKLRRESYALQKTVEETLATANTYTNVILRKLEQGRTLQKRKLAKGPRNVRLSYRGLMAPVFTIFDSEGLVNTSVILKYAKYLADSGIKAVLVHGTTGEGMSMTVAERKSVVEEWARAVKVTKQHLMVQVGGCPLPDALDLARHAEKIGADSLLCLPELYFKPSTPRELVNYLKIIGEAAPNTPLLYYHIPAWTGVNINMAQFMQEADGVIRTFQGIKFTSNDLDAGYDALKVCNGKFAVFLGADTLMAPAFLLGFDSVIATTLNFLPKYALDIQNAIEQSKVEEAKRIQEKVTRACRAITKHGAWVPTMKVAMNHVTPINVGLARPPLANLNQEQINEIAAHLANCL